MGGSLTTLFWKVKLECVHHTPLEWLRPQRGFSDRGISSHSKSMGYQCAEDMTLPQSDRLLSLRISLPRSQLNTALSKFEPTMLS